MKIQSKILNSFLCCFLIFYMENKVLEPVDGSSGWSCAKLKQICELVLVECLNDTPEPFDNFVIWMILSFVLCVGSPVFGVDVWHSIDKHLKFIWFENSEQIHGNDFVQSFPEITNWSYHFFLTNGFNTV